MLEDLFDIFERDRKKPAQRKTGLRGRLATMLGDSREDSYSASTRDRDDQRRERDWDDDDRDRDDRDGRHDDDRYDHRRSSRKRKREFDAFDFGD
jgi:hypothetical protein